MKKVKKKKGTHVKATSTFKFTLLIVCIIIAGYIGTFGLDILPWSKAPKYRVLSFNETIRKGLDLKGGVSLVFEIQDEKVDPATVERTMSMIRMRVDKIGVSEPEVKREGDKRIRVEIPGVYDSKEVADTVGKTGNLKFVGPEPEKEVVVQGAEIKNATVATDPDTHQPVVALEFSEEGTKKFAKATEKYMNQVISIYMDDELLSSPKVGAHITDGKATITGNRSIEEAKNLAELIKAGALPVKIKTVETKTVGATLGNNVLPLSVKAGVVGISLVFLFMIVMYGLPGLLADIALALYTILLLVVFGFIDAVLTLSGIAGFLLTIGMALDANVLIFERIKEELALGKSMKASVEAGFDRALSSILDSNITTIISGLVLYIVGVGTVKGFAITLLIGVIVSMFTAIVVSRFLLRAAVNMGMIKSIKAFGFIGTKNKGGEQ